MMIHSLHGADWRAIWEAVMTETDWLLLLMSWTAWKEQLNFNINNFPFSYLRRFFCPTFLRRKESKKNIPIRVLCKITFSVSRLLFSFQHSFSRFMFKVAIISHLRWHLLSDEGEVKSLKWLIIISKVPCHSADLNKRVWGSICMHLYAWAKRLMS